MPYSGKILVTSGEARRNKQKNISFWRYFCLQDEKIVIINFHLSRYLNNYVFF